jgi:hypothetical protein
MTKQFKFDLVLIWIVLYPLREIQCKIQAGTERRGVYTIKKTKLKIAPLAGRFSN